MGKVVVDVKRNLKDWNPTVYTCRDCGKEIKSEYPGQFSQCDCPEETAIYIDETRHYTRRGGDQAKFIKKEA